MNISKKKDFRFFDFKDNKKDSFSFGDHEEWNRNRRMLYKLQIHYFPQLSSQLKAQDERVEDPWLNGDYWKTKTQSARWKRLQRRRNRKLGFEGFQSSDEDQPTEVKSQKNKNPNNNNDVASDSMEIDSEDEDYEGSFEDDEKDSIQISDSPPLRRSNNSDNDIRSSQSSSSSTKDNFDDFIDSTSAYMYTTGMQKRKRKNPFPVKLNSRKKPKQDTKMQQVLDKLETLQKQTPISSVELRNSNNNSNDDIMIVSTSRRRKSSRPVKLNFSFQNTTQTTITPITFSSSPTKSKILENFFIFLTLLFFF